MKRTRPISAGEASNVDDIDTTAPRAAQHPGQPTQGEHDQELVQLSDSVVNTTNERDLYSTAESAAVSQSMLSTIAHQDSQPAPKSTQESFSEQQPAAASTSSTFGAFGTRSATTTAFGGGFSSFASANPFASFAKGTGATTDAGQLGNAPPSTTMDQLLHPDPQTNPSQSANESSGFSKSIQPPQPAATTFAASFTKNPFASFGESAATSQSNLTPGTPAPFGSTGTGFGAFSAFARKPEPIVENKKPDAPIGFGTTATTTTTTTTTTTPAITTATTPAAISVGGGAFSAFSKNPFTAFGSTSSTTPATAFKSPVKAAENPSAPSTGLEDDADGAVDVSSTSLVDERIASSLVKKVDGNIGEEGETKLLVIVAKIFHLQWVDKVTEAVTQSAIQPVFSTTGHINIPKEKKDDAAATTPTEKSAITKTNENESATATTTESTEETPTTQPTPAPTPAAAAAPEVPREQRYVERGLAQIQVNSNESTNLSRIIARHNTKGSLIMNENISKTKPSVSPVDGDRKLRITTISIDPMTAQPTVATYLILFRSGPDASSFLNTIKDIQSKLE